MSINTSRQLLKIIEKFHSILNSEPPYGDQFKGDIIRWIEKQIDKYANDKDTALLLQKNFLEIAIKYSNKNDFSSINKINADKVHIYFTKSSFGNRVKLKLRENVNDNQIVTLFRILQKELKIFDNTDEQIKIMLEEVFDIGYATSTSYLQRKKLEKKPENLFKVDWEELY